MPRPKLGREPYTATMSAPLLRALDQHAQSRGRTRSDLIEDAVRSYLGLELGKAAASAPSSSRRRRGRKV